MKDIKQGTQEQTPEQPSQETMTQEPEFKLTEDGTIEGDFSDFLPEDVKVEEQQSKEEKPNYYTPEEIQEIGIDKLDPNRIPPELLPWYKSMQADYTRKTQALAEERRVLEKVLDKALSHPELAKQFMSDPELIAAVQNHPELAGKLQAVSQMAQPEQQNPIKSIAEQARKLVEQQFGEEFDEFNPEHMAAFNIAVQQIQAQVQREQAFQQRITQLKASEPHFEEIDRYAEQKLSQMPYSEAVKIINALQNGDFETVANFWEQCRKEWYSQRLQQQQPQQAPQPTQVEPAGQGRVDSKPKLNPKELAYMSPDEQIEFLKNFV